MKMVNSSHNKEKIKTTKDDYNEKNFKLKSDYLGKGYTIRSIDLLFVLHYGY